jgi:hypothetical protein
MVFAPCPGAERGRMKIIASFCAFAFVASGTCATAQTAQLIVTGPPALAGSYAAVT